MMLYESVLNTIDKDVSFGFTKIRIFTPSELEAEQIGYSISPAGKTLTGDDAGDWRKSWLVIGIDESCGDPIFIDISKDGYPVYTAISGQGHWEAKPVAVSLEAFARSLSAVESVAKGREYPTALEQNPLTEFEKQSTLSAIRQQNPNLDISFWEIILSES